VIEDEVRYRLPVPVLGEVTFPLVRLQLGRIFRFRRKRIRALLLEATPAEPGGMAARSNTLLPATNRRRAAHLD